MSRILRKTALALATSVAVVSSGSAQAGAYVFAGEGNGVNVVTHPTGYVGAGGTVTVTVCIAPGSTNASAMEVPVQNIVDRFNLLVETLGNAQTRRC